MPDDDRKTIEAILERLPSTSTLRILQQLRAAGMPWELIEDRVEGISEDIASGGMVFSDEAERYVRRLLIATHALECKGANN